MSDLFVMLPDAKSIRRKLLESSKASLHILRGYQELAEVRGQKLTLMKEMRRELKEITLLLNRVEFLLPEISKNEVKGFVPGEGLPALPKGKKQRKQDRQEGKRVFLGPPLPKQTLPPIQVERSLPPPIPDEAPPQDKLAEIERRLARLSLHLGKL